VALIKAVDVSSHQTPSRAQLDQWVAEGCQLLVIHCYHDWERDGLKESTRAWAATAREASVWHLPYAWIFGNNDPAAQVASALDTWRSVGEEPGLLWLDAETYGKPVTDDGPNVDQILAAIDECNRQGVNAGMYTGMWWIDTFLAGDERQLHDIPMWLANYSSPPTLEIPAPAWGKLIGHQYIDKPVDWSVFDLEALTELAKGYQPEPADLTEPYRIALADVCDRIGDQLAAVTRTISAERLAIDKATHNLASAQTTQMLLLDEMRRIREQFLGPRG
jgi:hypothetical protein